MFRASLCAAACTTLLAACVSNPIVPVRTARINHIVFVKLNDPGQASALVADANATLGRLPSLINYSAGPHFDMGRAEVLYDYDVAMTMGFQTPEAYRAYINNPEHQAFVDRWRPLCEWIQIRDMIDETP